MKGFVVLSERALERVSHLLVERRLRHPEALAKKSGSDERTIRRMLRGERVQYRTVAEVAGALGVDVQELLDEDSRPVEGEIFLDWLLSRGAWGVAIAAAGSVAAAGASLTWPERPWATLLTQTLAVTALLLWLSDHRPKTFEKAPARVRIASMAAAQFAGEFRLAWLFWAAFYLWFAAAASWPGALGRAHWPILNALQNAGSLCLVACYEVLTIRTVNGAERPRRSATMRYGWFVIAGLLVLEFALTGGAAGGIGAEGSAARIFALGSGLTQGLALALLVGRLDDPHVGAGAPIFGLYIYACIQGSYAMMPGDTLLEHLLTVIALPLKCLLCLVVAWCAESGILWSYLARLRAADEVLIRRRRAWLMAYRDGAFSGSEFERVGPEAE
ncbi:MAG TPA: helix-turn-helix transcriptional regulator [Dongiaceae bacterium]|nr:helix-turn-helix transcriptional regulator [Dongiaceae bacterium]